MAVPMDRYRSAADGTTAIRAITVTIIGTGATPVIIIHRAASIIIIIIGAGKAAMAAIGRAIRRDRSATGGEGIPDRTKIGRASCRERVCQYVQMSAVAVSLKKK